MNKATIKLTISFESEKKSLELFVEDTVEFLKTVIYSYFNIPQERKIYISGWLKPPNNDTTLLLNCCSIHNNNHLIVTFNDMEYEIISDKNVDVELNSVYSCFEQIGHKLEDIGIDFNIVLLEEAVNNVLKGPRENRKTILLYLHNVASPFSNQFLNMIETPDVSNIIKESFYFIGWDIQSKKYHNILCETLNQVLIKDNICNDFINVGASIVIFLQNIHENIVIQGLLIENNEDELMFNLKNCQSFLSFLKQECISNNNGSEEMKEIDSTVFQKIIADQLDNGDYTCYESDQHELLKKNIGYALFGPPLTEEYYDKKQRMNIEKIYKVIIKYSEPFAEYKGQVHMSVIFNCTEPLPEKKLSKKKKDPNYNPRTDILPVPVFILRKCRESDDPCRIFIDDLGRKYESWEGYINNNKLPKCVMILPLGGRYKVEGEEVLLERHFSPKCDVINSVLKVGDIASTVGGIGAGGIAITATVVTAAAAPVALAAAAAVGITAGVYSVGRSIGHLVDKVKHDECLSITDSEARGIYFNLLAGSLGFVGAGANVLVTQLATRGVTIGRAAVLTVNAIGVANIGVSGASIVNSGYDVLDQWLNENQTPTLLTCVQLGSSILFFGNAVYNFKPAQTIVEEAQAKVIQDYSDSLRSNRHRKTFNKLIKETIRQNNDNHVQGRAEVIKTIRNIPNKDDVFANLTRNNKLMNKNRVKYFASNGEISLNGYSININELIIMNKQETSAFLSNLPLETNISNAKTNNFISDFSLKSLQIPDLQGFAKYALTLIGRFGNDIQGMLFKILLDLMPDVTKMAEGFLSNIISTDKLPFKVFKMLMEYFGSKAVEFLRDYKKWIQTGLSAYFREEYSAIPQTNVEQQYSFIFELVVKLAFNGGKLNKLDCLDIIKFVEKCIVEKYCRYQEEKEKQEAREENVVSRKVCSVCKGHYFNSNS